MRNRFTILFIVISLSAWSQDVLLNEIMASNQITIADEDGDYPDWIELYNSSNEDIDLSGWYLSDDDLEPLKWQFQSAIIQAQGYLVVFASSKDRPDQTPLHSNFKISSSGEPIILSNVDGEVVSVFPANALGEDVSYGCSTDGLTSDLVFFIQATPAFSNSQGEVIPIAVDEISFSVPAGFYNFPVSLTISATHPEAIVWYTTDGSEPSVHSLQYNGAILIQDRFNQPDVISLINTGINWEPPKSNGEKATVVKAASFMNGQRLSPVATASYFISQRLENNYKDLPVISLTVDADSLFDYERGIYVAGANFREDVPRGSGNYYMTGDDWERELTMEYFDQSHVRQFVQQVGARIHGNSSRGYAQKTLRIYARGDLDDPYLNYQFFQEKEIQQFKRILIRNSSTDIEGTMFKDILCSDLISGLDMDYQAAQVAIVFINGEYWGVQSIRERIDKYYISSNHFVHPDSLDILAKDAEVEEGDTENYQALLSYVSSHNLSQNVAYDYVRNQLDIENFMDYNISQLYFANFDWPGTNIRYWRPRIHASHWRWIFYDCDRCMLWTDYDQLENFVQENDEYNFSPEWSTLLFNRLLKNSNFKEEFIQRFFYHLSTTFKSDRVLAKIDSLESIYQPLVLEHMNRWNYPASINLWNESLQEMRSFAIKRPAVMVQQLMDYIGEQYALYPNPASQSDGFVNLDMEYTEGVEIILQIYTSDGRIVERIQLNDIPEGEHPKLGISKLNSGFYFVQIQYGSLLFTERLLIE